MRIALFLRNLQTGGAERQFLQLAGGLAARGNEVHLVTRTPDGDLSALLDPRVERHALFSTPRGRVGRGLELLRSPQRLRRSVQELQPDVVYSALFLNNALAHRALQETRVPLVWGFRNAAQPLSKLRARAWRYNQRHAADVPLAISNSYAGARYLEQEGLHFDALEVIPNGIDPAIFRPLPAARSVFRERFGLPHDAFVIGCVGRLHPMKDHGTFLAAAQLFARAHACVRFVCIGAGAHAYALQLEARAQELGLGEQVTWTGALDDMPAAYAGLDLVVSTSLAEGFPNALTEALACEVPVVASDVGDTATLLEAPEHVVPAADPKAHSRAWLEVLETPTEVRSARSRRDRERVVSRLSVERCVARTEEVLARVALLS